MHILFKVSYLWIIPACILIAAVEPAASAQNGHSHSGSQPMTANGSSAAGVIDGAVNPELISDQEAITVFWISIMEQPTAGAMEKNRFTAKTLGMHLTAADAALLWNSAVVFNNQFTPYLAQAQQLATAVTTPGSASSIAQQRAATAAAIDRLAMTTYNGLLSGLSPAGAAALSAKIADVKTHMKIIPPPKM